jgi:hypothetical protein
VAKVPAGAPTPQVAQFASIPLDSRPPLPAKYSQAIGPYTMYMETIASAAPSTAGLLAIPGCVVDSVFKRGMRVIFRYSIYETATGKPVTDRASASTKVQVAANSTVDGFFVPRGAPIPPPAGAPPGPPTFPPNAPWTWAAIWNIPTDFPLGNVDPAVQLTAAGKSTALKVSDFDGMPIQIVD